ncbi:hypothetical protein PHYPSEUDO_010922 [Phytophthora pseudosyringae]|uniref:Uncharacterized protein n=1 Tax=Phytophthora pseudosyringae TaxID=221518 RepID=A0A8T1VA13_9STRA|nr:hypothetical protein PHYPSEUDO_010922 [Phytophthora pseudosyringae]
MVAKRHAPFRPKYGVELGLRVKERDAETSEVLSASCLFCQLFGRESKPGAQRRATEKVAQFKPPFRKDSIQIHHVGQHPAKWAEYCALSSDDSKRAFFIAAGASMELAQAAESHADGGRGRKTPRNSNLNRVTTTTSTSVSMGRPPRPQEASPTEVATGGASPLHWLVNRDIVTVLVGVMLPYAASPVPAGQTYQLHAVADFEDMVNSTDGAAVDMLVARYRVALQDVAQFQQFVDYLGTSGSLSNTARMLLAGAQPAAVGPFFDDERQTPPINVARYARFLCAINFQRIADIAKASGIYAMGLKVAPIAPASFFEAQVEYCLHLQLRVFEGGDVTSLHVLSIPLNKRRRSDADGSSGVFEIAETALNALVPRWKDTMLAVISDSDGITAQESDDPRLLLRNAVASRFESVAKPGFLRVCCAARQLDSLVQKFFSKILGSDELYSTLTTLVAYVSRQRVLLSTLKTSAPSLNDSRWRSVADVAIWFRRHGAGIREHFELLQSTSAPPASWWIRILLAARIGQEAIPMLDDISGLTTESSHPRDAVTKLRSYLGGWFNISGPLEIDDLAVAAAAAWSGNDNSATSKDGKYSIKTNDVFTALEDLGTFIAETLQTDENEDEASESVVKTTVDEIATGVVNLVSELNSIILDIDGIDAVLSDLPAVLPQDLVQIRGRQFTAAVRPQVERLRLAGWSRQEIDWIEQDFQDLCGAYFREPSLKLALETCSNKSSFRDSWSSLQGRFVHLQRFCGIMATAYPIADISSDFTGSTISSSSRSMMGCNSLTPVSRITSLPGDLEAGVSDLSVQAALQAKQFRRLQAVRL